MIIQTNGFYSVEQLLCHADYSFPKIKGAGNVQRGLSQSAGKGQDGEILSLAVNTSRKKVGTLPLLCEEKKYGYCSYISYLYTTIL